MNFLPSRRIQLFTLTGIAILCAALLGYLLGVGDRQPALSAAAPDASANAEKQANELNSVTRQRDVARETVRQLQLNLADAQRMADDDRAELGLYRRIASDATPSGLSIDNVTRDEDALAITLIQSRGRKSVNGVLQLALTRINNEQVERLILPAKTGEDDIEFDFRFFETLTVPMVAVEGFLPQQLEITVRPNGKAYKEFKAEFAWEDVNQ